MAETLSPAYIFMSYSRADTDFANRLSHDLQASGFHLWLDRTSLATGENWVDDSRRAIDGCQAVLVLLSPDAASSRYVQEEYRYAFQQNKPVLPVICRATANVPLDLRSVQWCNLDNDYDGGLEALLYALQRIVPVGQEKKSGNLGSLFLKDGRYVIQKTLGQGGIGAVQLATDSRIDNKIVVIKELISDSTDLEKLQEDIRNSNREVEILAQIDHPLVPNVTDLFQEGSHHFMVQEYVEGENLQERMERARRPLPEREALTYASQMLDVLDYLEQQTPPIVHCDIKPANIIIGTKDKRAHLVGFSIAHTDVARNVRRKQTSALGTPGYAPPEQYQGNADPRSDLYALGATLHYILTNRNPVDYPPFFYPPVRTLNSQLSPEIEQVLTRALTIGISKRYQAAAAMKQDIDVILARRFDVVGTGNSGVLQQLIQEMSPVIEVAKSRDVSPTPLPPPKQQLSLLQRATHTLGGLFSRRSRSDREQEALEGGSLDVTIPSPAGNVPADSHESITPTSSESIEEPAEEAASGVKGDEQIIYISPEDDITSVSERMKQTPAQHVVFIVPGQSQLRSNVTWRVLYNRATEQGKDVLVVSTDVQIRSVAQAAKFRVASALEAPPRQPRPEQKPAGQAVADISSSGDDALLQSEEAWQNLEGRQLSSYRLVRLLGRGGFYDTYLGEDISSGNQVAIKVSGRPTTELSSEEVKLFQTEAGQLSSLSHPHIIPIMYYGIDGSTLYIVTEYAAHGSLFRRYPPGTLVPLDTIITYVEQIGDALQYLHNQKIIHRDVKPSNMLLRENDDGALSDFAIAILYQAQEDEAIIGTPAYMAPEQWQGRAIPASDQYALAVVVYQWLCGDLPFTGGTSERMMYQHLSSSPPSLREKNPAIPLAIEQVVMRALAKNPAQRYPNVSDLVHALGEMQNRLQEIEKELTEAGRHLQDFVTALGTLISGLQEFARLSGQLAQQTSPPDPGSTMARAHKLLREIVETIESTCFSLRDMLQLLPPEQEFHESVQRIYQAIHNMKDTLGAYNKDADYWNFPPVVSQMLAGLTFLRQALSALLAIAWRVIASAIQDESIVYAYKVAYNVGREFELAVQVLLDHASQLQKLVHDLEQVATAASRAAEVAQQDTAPFAQVVTYSVLLALQPAAGQLSIGGVLTVALYLSFARGEEGEGYLLTLSRDQAIGNELSALLTAPGFQVGGESATSMPIELPDPDRGDVARQVKRFHLTALRPGKATITADLYVGAAFVTSLEREVEVQGLDEERAPTRLPITTQPRSVSQPDLILQVQTEWDANASSCSFHFTLNSFSTVAHILEREYHSDMQPAGWIERCRRLLASTLEDCADGQPEDLRVRLVMLGYGLFQRVLPAALQNDLRMLARHEHTLTLLILADQDAWLPWELLHSGRGFLGEHFAIGRWPRELDSARPYEFPVGAVHVAHYANVDSPEAWADILAIPGLPEPVLMQKGSFTDLQVTEGLRGLHLLRYGQLADARETQDAPVPLEQMYDRKTLEADVRPTKLTLHCNHPLVSLGYIRAGKSELTTLEQAWAPTFLRAGCSAFIGPLWAVHPAVEAAFASALYSRLWSGDSLVGALHRARHMARLAAPESLDWLAYVLFGDPMARAYRPVPGHGYAIIEPIGREIEDPLPPGGRARFRVSLRRTPPVWHDERVVEVAEALTFENMHVRVKAFDLTIAPSSTITMTQVPNGDYLGWFALSAPDEVSDDETLVQVYFLDGDRLIHSLMFPLTFAQQGGRP